MRNINLRIRYLMNNFSWVNLELVEVGVVEMNCMPSLARASRAQGCRVNLRAQLYINRIMGQLYMQTHPPVLLGGHH